MNYVLKYRFREQNILTKNVKIWSWTQDKFWTYKQDNYIFCEVAQSCPTLCNPMDCSLPASAIHGIFQARVLEWVAISFSRDQTRVSYIAGRCFTIWATRGVPAYLKEIEYNEVP